MSILNGKIQYEPDPAKNYGYGETYKIKVKPETGDAVTLFVKADHADAGRLTKGAIVYYKMVDGKPRFEGVDQAQPVPTSPAQSPQATPRLTPTVDQLISTYVDIWVGLTELGLDDEGHRQATATVFIAATQAGAYATKQDS